MDVSEAIRFLGLNFLETCQEYLDESTYSSAKVLIEQTKKEKLLKKVLKFMKPFEPLINKETITKDDLDELDIFSDEIEMEQEKINEIHEQVKICFTVCKTISEIDPGVLKQIENVAAGLQMSLQTELQNLPETERTVEDPNKMLHTLFSAMNTSNNAEDGIVNALNAIQQDGTPNDGVGDVLNKVVPNILSALNANASVDASKDKASLLDFYSKIDGNTK